MATSCSGRTQPRLATNKTLPGIGSALRLVGLVSVHCDRVIVESATYILLWQQVKLSRASMSCTMHVAGALSNQETKGSLSTLPPPPLLPSSLTIMRQIRSYCYWPFYFSSQHSTLIETRRVEYRTAHPSCPNCGAKVRVPIQVGI